MIERHVLNLGAGVQSTALYLMMMEGRAPKIEAAVFADTQEEPAAVYRHLEWLIALNGPRIIVATLGKLGDDLLRGEALYRVRFAAIPSFILNPDGRVGRTRRQCSKDYKILVIERAIRREVCGLQPRQRVPKNTKIHQYFGISLDEKSRATRIWERHHVQKESIGEPHFPLIEMQMTRANCLDYLEKRVPHPVPRSACVFCPFHTDLEWQRLKDAGGPDWDRLVQIDHGIRQEGVVVNRNMNLPMFLHRACKPIDEIDFKPKTNPKEMQLGFGFGEECEGVCGV